MEVSETKKNGCAKRLLRMRFVGVMRQKTNFKEIKKQVMP